MQLNRTVGLSLIGLSISLALMTFCGDEGDMPRLPYEGLIAMYRYVKYTDFPGGQTFENSTTLVIYKRQVTDDVFLVDALDQLNFFPDMLADLSRGIYLSGVHTGRSIIHIIRPDRLLEDTLRLDDRVLKIHPPEKLQLNGFEIEAIRVSGENFIYYSDGGYLSETNVIWFERRTGLMLRSEGRAEGYGVTSGFLSTFTQVSLVDSGADNDGDGMTDYKELLLKTNPLSADTDHDLFPDGIDAMPWGRLIPAWPLMAVLGMAGAVLFSTSVGLGERPRNRRPPSQYNEHHYGEDVG
ncbi:MAG: thrombospondin type 3 repeat-containing protein [Nitrososphaerota archaeon]